VAARSAERRIAGKMPGSCTPPQRGDSAVRAALVETRFCWYSGAVSRRLGFPFGTCLLVLP